MGVTLIFLPAECRASNRRIHEVLSYACRDITIDYVMQTAMEVEEAVLLDRLRNKRILFALELDQAGINFRFYELLSVLRRHEGSLQKSVAGLLVDGNDERFTKNIARELVYTANEAGCWFVGRPLTEGTGSLLNYSVRAVNWGCSLYEAYLHSAKELVSRILKFEKPVYGHPKLLCVHACNPSTSNTWQLWQIIKGFLSSEICIREISLRDGEIHDCAGCSYEMCMYFSEKSRCFYGGPIIEEVYPALEECNGLILLCPNYNDAIGANLTALINRLTALFRKKPFEDKCLFSLIVSGYSGGDILAEQFIDGLNMNKSFILPGNFSLLKTANAPGSLLELPDIQEESAWFAENINRCMR